MRTTVYVDGFNLFYGIKRYENAGTCYRWLDLATLCRSLMPKANVTKIRYFTAEVDAQADPNSPLRQKIYWRALATIPTLEMHLGQFLASDHWYPMVNPLSSIPAGVPSTSLRTNRHGIQMARVTRIEEKGSDVNLAAYMLLDCFRNAFDRAIVVTNDSDLMEPIRIVRQEFGCTVGVFNPGPHWSSALKRTASFYTQIKEGTLKQSMFPPTLTDANGTITKPPKW